MTSLACLNLIHSASGDHTKCLGDQKMIIRLQLPSGNRSEIPSCTLENNGNPSVSDPREQQPIMSRPAALLSPDIHWTWDRGVESERVLVLYIIGLCSYREWCGFQPRIDTLGIDRPAPGVLAWHTRSPLGIILSERNTHSRSPLHQPISGRD